MTNSQSVLALADNFTPAPKWAAVIKALEANDAEKIALFEEQLFEMAEHNAKKYYLKRLAVQSIVAASLGDVMQALKADENDVLALFKNRVLMNFAFKHGLTVYNDISQILPGDSVVIAWTYKEKKKTKTSTSTLRILEPQKNSWLVSLAMYENWEPQFEAHKQSKAITDKNFVIGVRQVVPPIMKKPQKFYFLNFL